MGSTIDVDHTPRKVDWRSCGPAIPKPCCLIAPHAALCSWCANRPHIGMRYARVQMNTPAGSMLVPICRSCHVTCSKPSKNPRETGHQSAGNVRHGSRSSHGSCEHKQNVAVADRTRARSSAAGRSTLSGGEQAWNSNPMAGIRRMRVAPNSVDRQFMYTKYQMQGLHAASSRIICAYAASKKAAGTTGGL